MRCPLYVPMPIPPWSEGLEKTRIGEPKVKGYVAGEVRSEPRNETSVRFRSGAMVKMPELVENIPKSELKIKI